MTQERGKKFKVGDLVAFVEDWGHCFGVIVEVELDYYVTRLRPRTASGWQSAPMPLMYIESALERAIWTFTGPVVPAWRTREILGQEWLVEKLNDKYGGTSEFTERRQHQWNKLVELRRAASTR